MGFDGMWRMMRISTAILRTGGMGDGMTKTRVGTCVKFLIVVAISGPVGMYLGLAVHSTLPRPALAQGVHQKGQVQEKGQVRSEPEHPSQITSKMAQDAVARGPHPRRLAVEVGEP